MLAPERNHKSLSRNLFSGGSAPFCKEITTTPGMRLKKRQLNPIGLGDE